MSFQADSPTFTGNVTVPEPTQATDAASKAYADGVGARVMGGTVAFTGQDARPVSFDPALPDATYLVTATANAPMACWVTEKATTGFTLRTSGPLNGSVDWILFRG